MAKIKIGNMFFYEEQLTHVVHTTDTSETTTLYFIGGGTLEFSGDDAAAVWSFLSKDPTVEL